MLVPIPGQLAPMAPAPLPTGLTFEGSQQDRSEGHEGGEHQQEQNAGEGNNEGEENYYSFDYPPVCKHFVFLLHRWHFHNIVVLFIAFYLPPFVVALIGVTFLVC